MTYSASLIPDLFVLEPNGESFTVRQARTSDAEEDHKIVSAASPELAAKLFAAELEQLDPSGFPGMEKWHVHDIHDHFSIHPYLEQPKSWTRVQTIAFVKKHNRKVVLIQKPQETQNGFLPYVTSNKVAVVFESMPFGWNQWMVASTDPEDIKRAISIRKYRLSPRSSKWLMWLTIDQAVEAMTLDFKRFMNEKLGKCWSSISFGKSKGKEAKANRLAAMISMTATLKGITESDYVRSIRQMLQHFCPRVIDDGFGSMVRCLRSAKKTVEVKSKRKYVALLFWHLRTLTEEYKRRQRKRSRRRKK